MTRFNRAALVTGVLCVVAALPALAADPTVSKGVLAADDGSSVVVLTVSAADKAVYGKKLGLVHAGLHGVFSFILLPIAGVAWGLALILAIVEAVIHYHIDFTKENIVRSRGWTVTNRRFWWALASDQALHHFSYLAMGAAVVLWS